MIYVGIDPGKDGAIARVDTDLPGEARVEDVSVLQEAGKKRAYDVQGMRAQLVRAAYGARLDEGEPARAPVLVVIEAQQAMPGQGVTSMFSIGLGFGIWLGLLNGLQIPHKVVQPLAWKKRLMAGEPRTAQACVTVALRHYPGIRSLLVGPKGGLKDGRADAILLAEWGRVEAR